MSDPIIGIDLGTTNSVAARCDEAGVPQVLADDRGNKIQPSVVSFHPNGSVVVGAEAKHRRIIDPRNTVFSAKRLIGRPFRSREIAAAMQRMPYAIKEGANQQPVVVTRGGEFAVPEISAIVLDHMRGIAVKALGQEVSRAVVTVPASFNDAQRSATATAGAIAGITVVRVLNEPTAAALAYGHERPLSHVIAVYDFGGGTFDVTLLRMQDQVYEVLATAGDSFLGGDDIDELLMQHMASMCMDRLHTDVRDNEVAMMRLRAVAEQAKIELSRRQRALVKVDEIAYGAGGAPMNLELELSRDQLVTMAAPLVDKTFAVCAEALNLAGLTASAIEDVVMVGGTTKIPHVRERVTQFFQRAPRTDLGPEEVVALGAALQAAALERILAKRTGGQRPTPMTGVALPTAPQGDPGWDDTTNQTATAPEKRTTAPMGAPPPRPTTAPQGTRGVDPFEDGATGERRIARIGRITARGTAAAPPPLPARPPAAGPRQKTIVGMTAEPGAFDPDATRDAVPPPAEAWSLEDATARSGIPQPPPAPQHAPPIPPLPPRAAPDSRTLIGAEAPVLPGAAGPDARTLIGEAPSRGTDRGPRPSRPPAAGAGAPSQSQPGFGAPSQSQPGFDRAAARSQPGFDRPAARSQPGFGAPPPAPSQSQPGFGAPPPAPVADRAAARSQPGFGAPSQSTPGFGPTTQPGVPLAPPLPPATGAPTIMAAIADAAAPAPVPAALEPSERLRAPVAPPPGPTVVEVVPRGLGIGTVAGYCDELIRRNSRVPAETRRMFATSRDQQQTVRIRVVQGESRRIDDNAVLGDLVLENLPPRPRGATTIEVTFAVDASGILRVRARDAQTGQEQRASLDLVGTQSPAEVDAARERFANLRR